LSSVMADVARLDPGKWLASATKSYARSNSYATSVTPSPSPHEYDGLTSKPSHQPGGSIGPERQDAASAATSYIFVQRIRCRGLYRE
jgi:hypothetical protein